MVWSEAKTYTDDDDDFWQAGMVEAILAAVEAIAFVGDFVYVVRKAHDRKRSGQGEVGGEAKSISAGQVDLGGQGIEGSGADGVWK